MTNEELITRIEGYINKKYSEGQLLEIRGWMNRRLRSDIVRDDLMNGVRNKMRFLPLIKDFEEIINDGDPIRTGPASTQNALGMSTQQIYYKIRNIRKRQDEGERLSISDINFLAYWSSIEYYYESALDAQMDPLPICDKVRYFIDHMATQRNPERAPILEVGTKFDFEKYLSKVLSEKIIAHQKLYA